MNYFLMKRAPILFGIATLVACGGDSTAPSNTLAGAYVATQFVTTGSSGQTNQLLAGSTLSLNLDASGTVTGHLQSRRNELESGSRCRHGRNLDTDREYGDVRPGGRHIRQEHDVSRSWRMEVCGSSSAMVAPPAPEFKSRLSQQATL